MTCPDSSPAATPTGQASEQLTEQLTEQLSSPLSVQLTPAQKALLRLVSWVAMADGDFAEQERQLLETVVARTLPAPAGAAAPTVQTLAAEVLAEPDLEALVADLGDAD